MTPAGCFRNRMKTQGVKINAEKKIMKNAKESLSLVLCELMAGIITIQIGSHNGKCAMAKVFMSTMIGVLPGFVESNPRQTRNLKVQMRRSTINPANHLTIMPGQTSDGLKPRNISITISNGKGCKMAGTMRPSGRIDFASNFLAKWGSPTLLASRIFLCSP